MNDAKFLININKETISKGNDWEQKRSSMCLFATVVIVVIVEIEVTVERASL